MQIPKLVPKRKAVSAALLSIIAAFAVFAISCGGTETVVQTVVVVEQVPGETVIQTVVVEKEVQVAGETVVQTVVVEKEVQVAGETVIQTVVVEKEVQVAGQTVVQTVVVEKEVPVEVVVVEEVEVEKEVIKEVVEEVQVVVTATPEAMMEETVDLIDLPQSKSQPGHVIFADVGSALGSISGNGGSLPDAPLQADRWGAGEHLFTPGAADWDVEMLADTWDLADDLSSVTITIKQGVQLHDGWGELKAEDMAWVINRTNPAINPESIAASAANFTALFGDTPIEAIDDYTIVGQFNNFDVRWASNFLNQEASGGLTSMATSKRAFDENGREWLKDNFVGTGPFRVADFKSGTSVTLEKIDGDHWRKNAGIDSFKVLAVPEEFTRVALLQNGESDVSFIDPKDLARMKQSGFLEVGAGAGIQEGVMFPGNLWETTNALTGEAIDFPSHGVFVRPIQWVGNPHQPDDGDNPAGIDDMEQARLVRQALARSVDREAIVEHVLGGVGNPVHVTYFSTFNPNWDSQYEYPYDVDTANSMLDQAGYPANDNGVRFEMPLFVGPELGGGEGPAGEIGDAIAGFWTDVGINVKVLKYAYGVFRPGLVSRSTVVPMLTSCDDGQEAYPFDWPKGLVQTTLTRGGFSCGFESPDILAWYEAAASEPDRSERIRINKEYLAYMHNWALFPGYVTVPQAYYANPNYIAEWPMHIGGGYNSPENIVLK
ncbi:MAG: ABC transporter substrate-binding protein [Chloroflexi bacterium]|nr:ABC transporter substrate-binding protein [Chloroflexota bacterium]